MLKNKKVIIVGAGIAGAAAAWHLQRLGIEVCVLEGRNRVGGRIHTDESWGFPIELGANWLHHTPHSLENHVKRLRLRTQRTNYNKITAFDHEQRAISMFRLFFMNYKFANAVRKSLKFLQSEKEDISLQDLIQKFMPRDKYSFKNQQAFSLIEQAYENGLAASLNNISARSFFASEGATLGRDLLVYGGFGRVVEQLLAGVDLHLNTTVKEIRQSSGFVEVVTSEKTFTADFVIVTLPLGVLKSEAVLFSEPLPPEKLHAIESLRSGVMNKIIMEFEEKFWTTNNDFIVFLGDFYRNRGILLNYHAYTGKPVLVALPVHDAAIALERQGVQKIQQYWQDALHKAYPRRNIHFRRITASRWHGDIFSLGSYVHLPVGVPPQTPEILAAPFGRICFAGEATISHFHSTTHGAYVSGIREAERILGL